MDLSIDQGDNSLVNDMPSISVLDSPRQQLRVSNDPVFRKSVHQQQNNRDTVIEIDDVKQKSKSMIE